MGMRKRAWTQSDPTRWYVAVDHYHTARITLIQGGAFPHGRKVYAVAYGVSHVLDSYTLTGAKLAALDYAIQEGWM